jgi:hypothetical protein
MRKCVVPTQVGMKKIAFFVAAFLQAMFGALTLVFHEEIFGRLLNSVCQYFFKDISGKRIPFESSTRYLL